MAKGPLGKKVFVDGGGLTEIYTSSEQDQQKMGKRKGLGWGEWR